MGGDKVPSLTLPSLPLTAHLHPFLLLLPNLWLIQTHGLSLTLAWPACLSVPLSHLPSLLIQLIKVYRSG